jgi:hypothetical protein
MDFAALQRLIATEAGSRGPSSLCRPEFLEDAARLLLASSSVAVVTGFFIQRANSPETDGPPGAVVLARALERIGKTVVLLTDARNFGALSACSRAVGGPEAVCLDDPEKIRPDTLPVFIERPGHAADGRYYNMRGDDISAVVAPLDGAADRALGRGVPVLGIGDGGNEAGMGLLRESLAEILPGYRRCLSVVSSTVCLPADVSNWGGYALAAVLSVFSRRWTGLDEGEEGAMLEALLESGAVDGFSGAPELSVDGVPLSVLDEKSVQIKNWSLERFRV